MSAEGKKKRGESGRSKAASNPFRLNGLPHDWQARRIGAHQRGAAHSSGRKTINGIAAGFVFQNMGLGRVYGSEAIYERMLAHAEDRGVVFELQATRLRRAA